MVYDARVAATNVARAFGCSGYAGGDISDIGWFYSSYTLFLKALTERPRRPFPSFDVVSFGDIVNIKAYIRAYAGRSTFIAGFQAP